MAILLCMCVAAAADDPERHFTITVVDEQTGRGVPLVELKTTNNIRYYTDSNGIVAFYEPGLMNQKIFFFVKSHGYEFAKDGFGMAGRILDVTEGGSAELKIKRVNIAERLYRITGQGIYRDSVLAGRPVPIREPVINGLVMGSDSIQHVVYQGLNYWFWGDTGKPSYPLGNFHMTGATSPLPEDGTLDPGVGINFRYFVGEDGFVKRMAPRPEPGPVWCDAFVSLPDETGRERMFAAYARVTRTMEAVERGIMRYEDDKQVFEKLVEFDLEAPVRPGGHPFRHAEGGVEYLYFPTPFPLVRVRAKTAAYLDVSQYESFTCLTEGARLDSPRIYRDAAGRIRYAWRRGTPPPDVKDQNELIKAGQLRPEESLIQLRDVDSGKAVVPHSGSVYWNPYRGRWITIRCEIYGTSMLGETWYAEADTPLGPWVYARKVVTHDQYSFYNPKHHPVFDQQGGRIIYFEGTYTHSFSGNPDQTPRYDYNQIMYRLDLADPRLVLPVPVYLLTEDEVPSRLRTWKDVGDRRGRPIAFFAPDRPAPGTVPAWAEPAPGGGENLRVGSKPGEEGGAGIVFYALPADLKDPAETTVFLYEFVREDGRHPRYGTNPHWTAPGYRRSERPVCRVWKSQTGLAFPLD